MIPLRLRILWRIFTPRDLDWLRQEALEAAARTRPIPPGIGDAS